MLRLSKLLACRRGSMTTVVAVSAPVALICAGAAIDYMNFVSGRSSLRAKLDAAVISSAQTIIDRVGDKHDDVAADIRAAIRASLAANGASEAGDMEILVDMDRQIVSIDARIEVPTAFMRIAGIDVMTGEIRSSASAEIDSQPVCILALKSDDGTGISFEGNGEMKAKNCVVWSNATGMQSVAFNGGGKVSASRLCARGRVGETGRFNVKPDPESNCETVDDPLKEWEPPESDGCTYRIEGWVSRTTAHLDPGVYCGGLRVDAKNIFMAPGLYTIKDGPLVLRGRARYCGKAVASMNDGGDAKLDIDGKSAVELKAGDSGPMSGIVIAAARDAGNLNSTITGRSDLKIGGVIYLPTHDLTYYGESDTYAASPVTTIIGHTLKIGGEAFLEVKNDKKKAKHAPLVQTRSGSVRLIN